MILIERIKEALANPVGGTAIVSASDLQELITRLEAAEKDATKWHEYQAKKKVLADRGFGKSPMRDMKEPEK